MTKFHLDKFEEEIVIGSIVAWPTKVFGKRVIVIGKVVRMTGKGFKLQKWDMREHKFREESHSIEQVSAPKECLVVDDLFCNKFGQQFRGEL